MSEIVERVVSTGRIVTVTSTLTNPSYTVNTSVVRIGDLVSGVITFAQVGYAPIETGACIKIGTISELPLVYTSGTESNAETPRFPIIAGNHGQFAGMAKIDANGDIVIFLTTGTYNLQFTVAYKAK